MLNRRNFLKGLLGLLALPLLPKLAGAKPAIDWPRAVDVDAASSSDEISIETVRFICLQNRAFNGRYPVRELPLSGKPLVEGLTPSRHTVKPVDWVSVPGYERYELMDDDMGRKLGERVRFTQERILCDAMTGKS